MCRLCTLTTILSRERWPKPLEAPIADLTALVSNAHHEVLTFEKAESASRQENSLSSPSTSTTSSSTKITVTATASNPTETNLSRTSRALKLSLAAISLSLQLLESARADWWKSKAALRRHWEETCLPADAEKITKIQKINNRAKDMIKDMQAQLGVFAKWLLGMDMDATEVGE